MLNKPRVLWEAEAEERGADLARVQVWDAFSEMFLDSYRTDAEAQWLAGIIAASPFSTEETCHILYLEVGPVCAPNFLLMAGEWAGFDPDWLIGKCLKRQAKFPFQPGRTLPLFMTWNPLCFEASLLLDKVKRLRSGDLVA
jgi:hypothetical protein